MDFDVISLKRKTVMHPPPSIIPADDTERIQALRRYAILDTPPDGAFDRITALAARVTGTPIAIVSLVDTDRIWFKSHHGLVIREIDREPGLCASAILSPDAYILNDAATDLRSLSNPLVAGDFGLRYYVGIPLQTHDGFRLGTLCCLDFQPRDTRPSEIENLQDLAALVMEQMELRLGARQVDALHHELRAAYANLNDLAAHDPLTKLLNRAAILDRLDRSYDKACRQGSSLTVLMIDVDHFKSINDTHGHPCGDQVLREVSSRLKKVLRSNDAIGRIGGEEFLVMLEACDETVSWRLAERCRKAICDKPIVLPGDPPIPLQVSVSMGLSAVAVAAGMSVSNAIAQADQALYQAKRGGRNRLVISPVSAA